MFVAFRVEDGVYEGGLEEGVGACGGGLGGGDMWGYGGVLEGTGDTECGSFVRWEGCDVAVVV